MKKTLFILVLLSAIMATKTVVAQNCVIHLFSKGWQTKVYVNDKLITGLNKDEALEYTVPAKGRAIITVKFADNANADITVDTEKDSDVYILAYRSAGGLMFGYGSGMASKTKIIDLKEWTKETKNFKDLITMKQE